MRPRFIPLPQDEKERGDKQKHPMDEEERIEIAELWEKTGLVLNVNGIR